VSQEKKKLGGGKLLRIKISEQNHFGTHFFASKTE
jgi:hypothetical protein